jgi:hypothetical protein
MQRDRSDRHVRLHRRTDHLLLATSEPASFSFIAYTCPLKELVDTIVAFITRWFKATLPGAYNCSVAHILASRIGAPRYTVMMES